MTSSGKMRSGLTYLQLGRQQLENVIDLVLETTRKHLVSLI